MAKREIYIGFSTVDQLGPPYTLTDIELVKRDLLNTFQTHRGERVMRPHYGTVIYDYLMEPFDEITREAILEDVRRIIDDEPRVELVNLDVNELEQVLRIDIVLNFAPQDVVDVLRIQYDRRNQQEL